MIARITTTTPGFAHAPDDLGIEVWRDGWDRYGETSEDRGELERKVAAHGWDLVAHDWRPEGVSALDPVAVERERCAAVVDARANEYEAQAGRVVRGSALVAVELRVAAMAIRSGR